MKLGTAQARCSACPTCRLKIRIRWAANMDKVIERAGVAAAHQSRQGVAVMSSLSAMPGARRDTSATTTRSSLRILCEKG
jgi:hypothetical protein